MMVYGQTIRYAAGPLGVLDKSGAVADGSVAEGDLGRYLGPAPDDGWHFTEPAKYPGKLCPVELAMIEAA